MIMFLLSTIAYVFFILSFYYLFKRYLSISNITIIFLSCFLALPAWKMNSILFILEIHFVILMLILRFILCRLITKKKIEFLIIMVLSSFFSLLSITYGYYNASSIIKTEYYLNTDKPMPNDYKIAIVSDLHYPTSTTKVTVEKLVEEIMKEHCDIVVLDGDIIDEYTSMMQRKEVFQLFAKLSKTSKVVYVYGNHDLGQYSFNNKISYRNLCQIIEENGIAVLRDEVLELDNGITLIGRDDYKNKARLEIDELIKKCKEENYLIVLDHQPKDLYESAEKGIDLHLSGHTHAGQIFPLYSLFEMLHINELNYGMRQINTMYAINTSGAGVWGVPIRTQKHNEYVILHIN